jgi:drug/metabolite transporter (DMT)-like permease
MLVILLAAVAAIGWGASDYFGGDTSSRNVPVFTIVAVAELIGAVMMLPVLVVHGTLPPARPGLAFAAAAGVAVTIELSLIYRALGNGQAYITAPVGALGAAIAACAGLIGGDPLSLTITAGLALALLGSGISSWTSPASSGGQGTTPLRTAAICLTAAASVAAMLTCLHIAGRLDPYWATFTEHASTAATAGLIALIRERRSGVCHPSAACGPASAERAAGVCHPSAACGLASADRAAGACQPSARQSSPPGRRQLPRLAVIAATGLAGDLAYATASGSGALSIVAAISSLYPVTTITLALLFTGARPTRRQLAGITLALLGAALLGITR